MDVVYHTKKTALYSFCSSTIKTNNVDHVMQHTQKRGYLYSDKIHTKFGLSVALYIEV
jgi:hypothetical protein